MKYLLALTLFPVLLNAAPVNTLELSHRGGKIHASWHHPSCWTFQLRENKEKNTRHAHFAAGKNGQRNFTWSFPAQPGTNAIAICAVDEFGVQQEWIEKSIVLRERISLSALTPPDPLDPARWNIKSHNTLGETTQFAAAMDLTVTWDYTGPIDGEHDIRVYESTNLKHWSIAATLPPSSKGYTVQKRPYAFFRVVAVKNPANQELPGLITNLIMDP